MSLKFVGDYLQRDAGTISRYEAGHFPVRRGDLLALLSLFGVSEEKERNELIQLCEESWQKGWWDQHREDLGQNFINVPWIESRAHCVNNYEHMVVHGLLQTRDYAEALVKKRAAPGTTSEQMRRWVDLRLERQRALAGETPLEVASIIEESVLQRPVGGRQTMIDQFEHLIKRAQQPNITVRVVKTESGSHAAHTGSFVFYRMPSPYPDVANVETIGGALYLEGDAIGRVLSIWEDLEEEALSEADSISLIQMYAERI
ncbi:hypothetical protein JQS30_14555 [Natronoglycomyces albus]|uniref:DUF5753 domain-containing protein n=2 Tax=Natronoglycomyces albus TaxID=2811108 RepID=A0A895XPF3_9ACTN|nr:hypothetical protein JQS30_14555 [Natronoglycomyces albus]